MINRIFKNSKINTTLIYIILIHIIFLFYPFFVFCRIAEFGICLLLATAVLAIGSLGPPIRFSAPVGKAVKNEKDDGTVVSRPLTDDEMSELSYLAQRDDHKRRTADLKELLAMTKEERQKSGKTYHPVYDTDDYLIDY